MIRIAEFASREALMQAAASRLAEALKQAMAQRGEACAALSGGSTPEPAYRILAAMPIDWTRIIFLLVDERFVPPAHEASNEGMLRRTLGPALSAGARLLPMFADNSALEEAARRADAVYASQRADIALMGVGDDGHTASWFPQSHELPAALDLANPRTVIAVRAPGAAGSTERQTMTRAAIAKSESRLLLVTGASKRALLENAPPKAPVAALLDAAPTEIFWAE
jgi:6-phosphogluconolactonase